MARFTGATTSGLPANRSRPRTSTSAAKMTASAAAMTPAGTGSAPAAPWVSTEMVWPAALAACSIDSAAMYVCAMPVGHEVTATSFMTRAPPS
jgi:hypothetical protein